MIKTYDKLKIPEGIRIPFFGGKWYTYLSKLEMNYIRKFEINEPGVYSPKRDQEIIISLTSFPARIEAAYYAVKSLMLQSLKPDRIILWLAEKQFENIELPQKLIDLKRFGLEIEYCDDIKSHKKYYYAMRNFKSSIIVTYDDDIIFPEDSLEKLYKKHLQFKDCVVCNRGLEITLDKNNRVAPYGAWKVLSKEGTKYPSIKIMPSTGGGTLYPVDALDATVFDLDSIFECALTADDLWMKTMSLLKGTKVIKTTKYHRTFTVVEGSQTEHLGKQNVTEGQNDIDVKKLIAKYPEAFEKLCKE